MAPSKKGKDREFLADFRQKVIETGVRICVELVVDAGIGEGKVIPAPPCCEKLGNGLPPVGPRNPRPEEFEIGAVQLAEKKRGFEGDDFNVDAEGPQGLPNQQCQLRPFPNGCGQISQRKPGIFTGSRKAGLIQFPGSGLRVVFPRGSGNRIHESEILVPDPALHGQCLRKGSPNLDPRKHRVPQVEAEIRQMKAGGFLQRSVLSFEIRGFRQGKGVKKHIRPSRLEHYSPGEILANHFETEVRR